MRLFARRPVVQPPPVGPVESVDRPRVERMAELAPPLKQPKPGSAVAQMIDAGEAESFQETPLGGWGGEMLLPSEPPQQPRLEPTELPPPEWAGQPTAGNPNLAAAPPAELPDALAEMKRADEGDFDPPAPGQPVELKPLERPTPPPANWEEELQERQDAGDTELQPIIPKAPWARGAP
jgi:hypothetical protein